MILVLDANIVIAALLKDGKSREIIVSGKFTLVAPDFLREELDKHKDYIARKGSLSKDELGLLLALLLKRIRIILRQEYERELKSAEKLIDNDIKDAPYLACYTALKCDGVWTSDPDFNEKPNVKIFRTEYLLSLL
jgi:predicted nucleic acid-binding protein